jgi:hypothetical protein
MASENKGNAKAWHMPPSGKLSVGAWKIRLREKWNMASERPPILLEPPKKIGPVNAGVLQIIDGNKIQDGCRSGHVE